MTRKAVGEALKVNQPAVAKLERRTGMYVSNLRVCIEATGGRLNIAQSFHKGVSLSPTSRTREKMSRSHEIPR